MFLTYRCFVEAEIVSKWYAFIGGSIIYCLASLVADKRARIDFDLIVLSVSLFIGYLFIRTFFSERPLSDTFTLSLAAFVIWYFAFKLNSTDLHRNTLNTLIVTVCLALAVYGLMQYTGIAYHNRGFNIIGSFDNPAGFAACLSAGFPFCFAIMNRGKWLRYFGRCAAAIIALAVILSESRAGILAVAVVCAVYLGHKYFRLLKKYSSYIIPLSAIVFIVLAVGLFLLKKDSAFGRILIWENACRMIADKPLFGFGPSGFMSEYMRYQAGYFAENPDSAYALLADNVTHPFNEYLLLAVEYGTAGVALLLVASTMLIKSLRRITAPHLCIVSVAVFACFSYPLRYSFIAILLAYSLSSLHTGRLKTLRIKRVHKIVWCFMLGLFCCCFIRDLRFENRWGQLVRQGSLGKNKELLDDYAGLYARWNGDPMFLYNYGAVLNLAGDYSGSNNIMFQCIGHLNDYDVQLIMADNYAETGQIDMAVRCYMTAKWMIPNRFMPLYRMMKLYVAHAERDKAVALAKQITAKEIKIPSLSVKKFIRDAEEVIGCEGR